MRKGFSLIQLVFFLLLSFFPLYGQDADDGITYRLIIPPEGTKEALSAVEEKLTLLPPTVQRLDLLLSSTSGDLQSAIKLAEKIASLRDGQSIYVTAYIDKVLVGPLAVLPFASSHIVTTRRVTWGLPFKNQTEETKALGEGIVSSLIPTETLEMAYAWRHLLEKMSQREVEGAKASAQGESVTQLDLEGVSGIVVDKTASDFQLLFDIQSEEPLPKKRKEEQAALFEKIHLTDDSFIGRIIIGPKTDMISQATWIYVKAACDHFLKTRPACVIVELDTPGGEVFAAEKISDALKSLDIDHGIPVIAYINNWAISAGAMIAYSCRYIVSERDGSMGAATPVMMTEEGLKPVSEKMTSALRADFANKAALFGRSPVLAEAMVDSDVIAVLRDGKILKLASESDIRKPSLGESGDIIISAKGKLLTLTGHEMEEFGVANIVLPIEAKKMQFGERDIAHSFLREIEPFSQHPKVAITTFEMDYKTSFIAFIASPAVTSLLVFILMISLYLELSTPGIAVPGLIAFLSFFLLLVASYAQQSIAWFEPLIVLLGILLIIAEIAVFPTMGFLFGLGVFLIGLGTLLMIIPALHEISWPAAPSSLPLSEKSQGIGPAGEYALHVLSMVSLAFVLALLCIILLMRYDIRPKIFSRMHLILDTTLPPPPEMYQENGFTIHAGDEAVVVATLRPAGKIKKDGVVYDAMSTGGYINEGARVCVVEIRGAVILVEPRSIDEY